MTKKVVQFIKIALIVLILFLQAVPDTRLTVVIRVLLFLVLLTFVVFIGPKLEGVKAESNPRRYFKVLIVVIIFLVFLFSEVYFAFWVK